MKLVIFYKTKSSDKKHNPYHHGGLAANAIHTMGVLQKAGVDAQMVAVASFLEVLDHIRKDPAVTHVVIEAIWTKPTEVQELATLYPDLRIVVRAHSKIGFLQVEPEAIPAIRSLIWMQDEYPNVSFSSNNREFCQALGQVYGPVLYLPNLFDTTGSPQHEMVEDDVLRVASFGATRLLKLHPNAALAALQLARREACELEFYINSDNTPGGESVKGTIRNLFDGLNWAKLVEVDWQDAQTFRETIARMDLVYQLSSTETFCLVAADAVASGVPVVVGEAIAWVPKNYRVNVDNTSEAAAVGSAIMDQYDRAVDNQQDALTYFVDQATRVWMEFLDVPKKKNAWWKIF